MTPDKDNRQGACWDDAELNTLRAGAALTFREKLHWLEEAEKLGNRLLTCRVRYPDPKNSGAWLLVERHVDGPRPCKTIEEHSNDD
jgi:hypothetical protein